MLLNTVVKKETVRPPKLSAGILNDPQSTTGKQKNKNYYIIGFYIEGLLCSIVRFSSIIIVSFTYLYNEVNFRSSF